MSGYDLDLVNGRFVLTGDLSGLAGFPTSQFSADGRSATLAIDDLYLLPRGVNTATEEAHAELTRLRELDTLLAGRNFPEGPPGREKWVKSPLYSDQEIGVRWLSHRSEGGILGDEMGLGKTLELLCTFAELKLAEPRAQMLVICPKNVKHGWLREVEKHTNFRAEVVREGEKAVEKDIRSLLRVMTDIFIVHFDALIGVGREEAWSGVLEDLCKIPWRMLVIDEAHLIKNPTAKRTQAVIRLSDKLRETGRPISIYPATGTPVSEKPEDAWSLFRVLEGETCSLRIFKDFFTADLEELKKRVGRRMIRRLKVELEGCPERLEVTREVELSAREEQLYKAVRDEIAEELAELPELPLELAMTKMMKLRQMLNSLSFIGEDGDTSKVQELDDVVAEVLAEPTSKILIWTEWRDSVDMLAERYEHYGSVKLYGGIENSELAALGRSFDSSSTRVVVAIPAFAGTGIDFLSRCRTAVYLETPWSTVLFRQSLDRIVRRVTDRDSAIGKIKASPATLVFLKVMGTIDEYVYDRLAEKGSLVDALLNSEKQLKKLGRSDVMKILKGEENA